MITEIVHPDYQASSTDWLKWRLAYEGGRRFINTYLQRYSTRETKTDFQSRKRMTYCPSFAKAAVNDVNNSIYQRMVDIKRVGGDPTYQDAIDGKNGGVDMKGSSMDNFMGKSVLPELTTMKRTAIYVDMPKIGGETVHAMMNKRPYVYMYRTEDIRSWDCHYDGSFKNVLLRDWVQGTDDVTGLPVTSYAQYRHMWLSEDGVRIQMYNDNSEKSSEEYHFPRMTRIPLISLELPHSLMCDIADYQIALLNLDSSDLAYLFRANFPFYVEEYEPRAEGTYSQSKPVNGEDEAEENNRSEVVVGAVSGRRYPRGMKAPSFIHPSSEPITAAMAKEEQLKNEMRQLLNLSLGAMAPKFASAESKAMDQGGLESGLSAIGLTMEYAEREVAKVWAMYLGDTTPATVDYPEKYSLLSEDDRRKNADQLDKFRTSVPSITFKKEISKKIATMLLEHCVEDSVLNTIHTETDDALFTDGDFSAVAKDVELGLVTAETASTARGYKNPRQEVKTAKKEHVERLAEIQKAQTPKPVQGINAGPGNTDVNGDKLNKGAGRPPSEDN